jgi:hypothetical protein
MSNEQTFVGNSSLVEPAPGGVAIDAPFTVTDNVSKQGWLAGVYVQDEWKVTNNFTINAGLRFDQMWQYVDANQLSPRINFTYKPFEFTTFHAGYARYFTPPVLVEAAPADIALFNGTTGAPLSGGTSPVLPERSHYFDAGVDQNIPFGCSKPAAKDCTDLDLGVDAYYEIATDLIDNGNFGQALVLSAFNYAKGIVEGVEFSGKFHSGNFQAYANLALGFEKRRLRGRQQSCDFGWWSTGKLCQCEQHQQFWLHRRVRSRVGFRQQLVGPRRVRLHRLAQSDLCGGCRNAHVRRRRYHLRRSKHFSDDGCGQLQIRRLADTADRIGNVKYPGYDEKSNMQITTMQKTSPRGRRRRSGKQPRAPGKRHGGLCLRACYPMRGGI